MHLGLFLINGNVCGTDPDAAVRVATAAEAAGWESVWTGEHYALPDPPVPASPATPDTALLDPFVALAYLAAHTRTLRLGTGVTVVPLHHPLVLAKQVASIDRGAVAASVRWASATSSPSSAPWACRWWEGVSGPTSTSTPCRPCGRPACRTSPAATSRSPACGPSRAR